MLQYQIIFQDKTCNIELTSRHNNKFLIQSFITNKITGTKLKRIWKICLYPNIFTLLNIYTVSGTKSPKSIWWRLEWMTQNVEKIIISCQNDIVSTEKVLHYDSILFVSLSISNIKRDSFHQLYYKQQMQNVIGSSSLIQQQ